MNESKLTHKSVLNSIEICDSQKWLTESLKTNHYFCPIQLKMNQVPVFVCLWVEVDTKKHVCKCKGPHVFWFVLKELFKEPEVWNQNQNGFSS